jgi:hypothetical protein
MKGTFLEGLCRPKINSVILTAFLGSDVKPLRECEFITSIGPLLLKKYGLKVLEIEEMFKVIVCNHDQGWISENASM